MNILVEPSPNPVVAVGSARFGNKLPLALIAGPCALESREHAFEMACALKDIATKVGIGLIYKTSFDKANRTSVKGKPVRAGVPSRRCVADSGLPLSPN